jgi:heptosyltransferase-2
VNRALVVRAGALGDILLLRRAVFALRRAGFESTLLAPAAPGSALVGRGESEVAGLIDWNRPDAAALFDETAAVPEPLRSELCGFEAALICSRNQALCAQIGALVPRVVAVDPTPPAGRYAARWYSDALAPLGIVEDGAPPSLLFTDDERAQAAAWSARLPSAFLALHPGSGSAAKNWSADRFAALARALSPDRDWLLVSGPADEGPVAALSREPGAVRAHELPPRVLGALLTHAGVYVGNDSGVTHIAAASGAHTLALFGPTDPAQWAPLGSAVKTLRAPGGRMERLPAETAIGAARAARHVVAGECRSRQGAKHGVE